jgi:hypothetical protein
MAGKLHGLQEVRTGTFSPQAQHHVNGELLSYFALNIAWGSCLNV